MSLLLAARFCLKVAHPLVSRRSVIANREVSKPWTIRTEKDQRTITLEPGARVRILAVDELEVRLMHFGWFSAESVLWYTDPVENR